MRRFRISYASLLQYTHTNVEVHRCIVHSIQDSGCSERTLPSHFKMASLISLNGSLRWPRGMANRYMIRVCLVALPVE